ncbi:MAG: bifunctional aspartate kinase/homoserine dehydrogenase I [Bacteroidetes bacterium]|nr:bifunctional aspartate kinase/homoserine dehydrogenase I [Bacteroidota bacterium]
MKVIKFGGTSVGSANNLKKVAEIIIGYKKQKQQFAVVISAMKGITNQLIKSGERASKGGQKYQQILKEIEKQHIETVKELIQVRRQSHVIAQIKILFNELEDLLHGVSLLKELSLRTLDLIQSFGERLSVRILAEYLNQCSVPSDFLDTREIIVTDQTFGAARVNFGSTNKKIRKYFEQHRNLQIITGFISSSPSGETTTLGRGGSDYTASIIAAALGADEIEIWTDVDGVMTADPNQVPDAFSLPSISYVEAMEMSYFGAKVIYPPTLHPALNKKIPLRIKNTFHPEFPGTLINKQGNGKDLPVKGISSIENISLISVIGSGMVGVPGVSSRLFGALANQKINVILITQASSEHSICFAVTPDDARIAKQTMEEEFELQIINGKIDRIQIEDKLSIVAIIGENMRHTPGISGNLFGALGKNGINVVAIAQGSSELNLSVVVKKEDLSKTLNSLHESFFLSDVKTLNIYLIGTGLIGGTLLGQIKNQSEFLLTDRLLKLKIVALANSRNTHFDKKGIDIKNWRKKIDFHGQGSNLNEFVNEMRELNLPNSVFVDCTSSQQVIHHYNDILESSISIVTPNKLANSSSYADYDSLQKTAFSNGVKFLYETNVGAGLPVISTLKDLRSSGDKILKIEGVLSGTLSYIFNSFQGDREFCDVVREAKEKGYTEPDPRDDLNGTDVARKILILAREAGLNLEPNDVAIENILPPSCMNAKTMKSFFVELEKANPIFREILDKASQRDKVLRFIASMEDGKAKVSLQAVNQTHPFYSISGSDNIISFTTERYKDRPLVIKGPGAGAEVTAAGVFAEIISISNYMVQGRRFFV